MKRLVFVLTLAALALTAVSPVSARTPGPMSDSGNKGRSDNLPGPLSTQQTALRQQAIQMVLNGEAVPQGADQVVRIRHGKGGTYVQLAFEGSDKILTLLGQFGNQKATHDHGSTFGVIDHGGADGPLHNQIPQPNRANDNTTIWEPDFSQAYYQKLLFDQDGFPSMAGYYLEQSSGQYTVEGYVSDWVNVPYNAAAYGSNYCESIVCTRDIGRFIEDQADTWWTQLVAQQGSIAAANAWLAQFDVWDRYDYNGNGNFDEPDGYIDHFQSVHAGEGEETGGGAEGEDAIWSHRSYVNSVPIGSDGPAGFAPNGGARIGESNYWIGDYTVEPENGGVGVFAHEFAHDLGLPDEYDGGGNTGFAENGTGWWTIMSQGSYGTYDQNGLGTYPTHFSAWDKLQLGFLENFTVATSEDSGRINLGPAEFNTPRDQAAFILLPDKVIAHRTWKPFAGSRQYFSSTGPNLDNSMTRAVHLGPGPITASFKSKYHIEGCWDYAYFQISNDGGTTWTNVHTSASSGENTNNTNQGEGITGVSGTPLVCDDLTPAPQWVDVTADLSAWANMDVMIRFSYVTDGLVNGDGFAVDNLQITGLPLDTAETDPGWEYEGFVRINRDYTTSHFNAYVLENRQYIGYDYSLQVGPYNYGVEGLENKTERFPYQNGLLIWYWDSSAPDNNVSEHPGSGLILPVDAHPKIAKWADGHNMRPRIQSYDATFTTVRTQPIHLHEFDHYSPGSIGPLDGVSVFNDNLSYWVKKTKSDKGSDYKAKWNSVIVPHTGTTIKIIYIDEHVAKLQLN